MNKSPECMLSWRLLWLLVCTAVGGAAEKLQVELKRP